MLFCLIANKFSIFFRCRLLVYSKTDSPFTCSGFLATTGSADTPPEFKIPAGGWNRRRTRFKVPIYGIWSSFLPFYLFRLPIFPPIIGPTMWSLSRVRSKWSTHAFAMVPWIWWHFRLKLSSVRIKNYQTIFFLMCGGIITNCYSSYFFNVGILDGMTINVDIIAPKILTNNRITYSIVVVISSSNCVP